MDTYDKQKLLFIVRKKEIKDAVIQTRHLYKIPDKGYSYCKETGIIAQVLFLLMSSNQSLKNHLFDLIKKHNIKREWYPAILYQIIYNASEAETVDGVRFWIKNNKIILITDTASSVKNICNKLMELREYIPKQIPTISIGNVEIKTKDMSIGLSGNKNSKDILKAHAIVKKLLGEQETTTRRKLKTIVNLERDLLIWDLHQKGLSHREVKNRYNKQRTGDMLGREEITTIINRIEKRLKKNIT